MNSRIIPVLLLLLVCLCGCSPPRTVEHSLYTPDRQVTTLLPKDVALAELNRWFEATEAGIRVRGNTVAPYADFLYLELLPQGQGRSLVVLVGKGFHTAGREHPVDMEGARRIVECLISLGARIQR